MSRPALEVADVFRRYGPAWRAALGRWRDEARARIGYDGSAYEAAGTGWTQRCFAVALAWLWDERLYNHASERFTPERFLADAERFGGIDGIVLIGAEHPGADQPARDRFRHVAGAEESNIKTHV